MADTDFWRKAEIRFRRLQPRPPQPGEVQRDSHNGLCAHWNPNGWSDSGDPWYLSNGDHGIAKLFTIAAESAAIELGHAGGPTALFFWLDLLRQDSPFYKPFGLGGYIYRVCDASAEHCLRCETNVKAAVLHPKHSSGHAPRRGYRPEIKKWMKDNQIETIPLAAKRLQVGFV